MGNSQQAAQEDANKASTDVVELVGHLSKDGSKGHHRLYKDPTHKMWIELDGKDIVDVREENESDMPGQSVISVRRSATVVKCESLRASIYDAVPQKGTDPDEISGSGQKTQSGKWPRPPHR